MRLGYEIPLILYNYMFAIYDFLSRAFKLVSCSLLINFVFIENLGKFIAEIIIKYRKKYFLEY